jgi:diguanylate cyclase (GGDEF)-like protein/PAS domain S-box-containing protein
MINFGRQLSFVTYLLIFALLQLLLTGLLSYGKQQVSDSYREQFALQLENDFAFTLSHYRELSQLFFQTEVNQPSILSLMEQAGRASEEERTRLRQQLLVDIQPMFDAVKNRLRHVHFHLADGDSFLRMHMPDLFGDNLYEARESIRLIGKEKQFLEGFELGRHHYAIRYLYPLFNMENTFLGSVETGISFHQFRKSLYELAKGEYFLLVKRDIAEKKLVAGGKENFQFSLLSDQFLMEKIDLNEKEMLEHVQGPNHISSAVLTEIGKNIKKQAELQFSEEKAFSLPTRVARQDYLVSFLPLKNIVNNDIGYLVWYTRDATFAYIERGYFLSYFIGTILVLFILILYRWSTNKIFSQLNFQQNLIDSIPTPLLYTDSLGKYLGSNTTFSKSFSFSEEISLQGEKKIDPPLDSILPQSIIKLSRAEEKGFAGEEISLPDQVTGQKRYFYCYTSRFDNPAERQSGLITAMFDVSDRKEAEKELSKSHAEIEQIFNTAADGMRVVDKDYNVLRVNWRLLEMSGMEEQELLNLKCYEVFQGVACKTDTCPLQRILGGEEWVEYEAIKRFPNGKKVPCIITATPYRDSDGEVVGIIEDFKDISDRKEFEQQLKQLARTDDLTGLMNRRGFIRSSEHMLHLAARQKKEIFLLFADLDNMKNINDDYGHIKGDFALQQTAELLSNTYRETDIIGRLGGDEFAVLLFDVSVKEKDTIADRFQQNLVEWNKHSTEDFVLALSIGVVQYPSGSQEDMEALLHRADQAMYEVKKQRKVSGG